MKYKIGEKVRYYFKSIVDDRIVENWNGTPAIVIGLPHSTHNYYDIRIISNQLTYLALERDMKKFNEGNWTQEAL